MYMSWQQAGMMHDTSNMHNHYIYNTITNFLMSMTTLLYHESYKAPECA